MRLWRHFILVGLVALGYLAWQFGHRQQSATNQASQAGKAAEPAASETPEARKAAEALRTQQEEAEARETRSYIEQLRKLEGERGQSLQAAEANDKARATVRSKREETWSTLIQTNMPAYQVLRKAAIDADDHSAHCTLCDGHGLMKFCVLCNGDGRCPTCGGSGKSYGSRLCATCLGSGKCFMCFGKGRMPCPFCDDGVIYANLPPPPANLPLAGAALSRPGGMANSNARAAALAMQSNETKTAAAAAEGSAAHVAAGAASGVKTEDDGLTAHQKLQLAIAAALVAIILLARFAPWIAEKINRRSKQWAPTGGLAPPNRPVPPRTEGEAVSSAANEVVNSGPSVEEVRDFSAAQHEV